MIQCMMSGVCFYNEEQAQIATPGVESSMSSRHKQSRENLHKHLLTFLKYGGKILTGSSPLLVNLFFQYQVGSTDWIPDLLFHSSELWTADDLSPLEICLIGAVAHIDSRFRDRLKRDLVSHRSTFLANRATFSNILFESTFGKASIVRHFDTSIHL